MSSDRLDKDGPADTRMMGIVHSAFRRDLVRCRMLLTMAAPPEGERRRALGEHVLWMMDFLHRHHHGEDTGLYPLVIRRNPAAAPLVDAMDAEHDRIAGQVAGLEAAARAYAAEAPGSTGALLDGLAALGDVLLPHLEREEVEMMPVVSASITRADWESWDKASNVKTRTMTALAMDGHWVLDGLDAEARTHVEHLVPPVPRFLLLKVLDGPSRRKRELLWDGTPAAEVPSLSIEAYRALAEQTS